MSRLSHDIVARLPSKLQQRAAAAGQRVAAATRRRRGDPAAALNPGQRAALQGALYGRERACPSLVRRLQAGEHGFAGGEVSEFAEEAAKPLFQVM